MDMAEDVAVMSMCMWSEAIVMMGRFEDEGNLASCMRKGVVQRRVSVVVCTHRLGLGSPSIQRVFSSAQRHKSEESYANLLKTKYSTADHKRFLNNSVELQAQANARRINNALIIAVALSLMPVFTRLAHVLPSSGTAIVALTVLQRRQGF